MSSFTISEAVKRLSEEMDLPVKMAKIAYYKVFEIVASALKEPGDRVAIPKFGTFTVIHKAERNGHNPSNGQPIVIPAHDVIVFKQTQAGKKQDEKPAKPAKFSAKAKAKAKK